VLAVLEAAAESLAAAEYLVIAAGAGIGVDSGLPDFRGNEGFWQAYPPYARLGLTFSRLANPRWFQDDPTLAWGFYGHRLHLYRQTRPHAGFAILRSWSARLSLGAFIFTSNVDGQFQQAGFDESTIVEIHGSIHHLQCLRQCGVGIFSSSIAEVHVNLTTMRASEPLPRCPRCGSLARPNILMFDDGEFDAARTARQRLSFASFLASRRGHRLVIVECGAGMAIPTVRWQAEQLARQPHARLIRINPRESSTPNGHLAIPLDALEAIQQIDRLAFSS
jgi:NAD-dependent SIR2 family protein deacetylase